MQTRSAVALGTLAIMIGLIYFGRFLPSGRAGLLAEHPHESITCQSCHRNTLSQVDSLDDADRSENCSDCHFEVFEASSPFHLMDGKSDCGRCHSFHKPEQLKAVQDTMSLEFAVKAKPLCLDCHGQNGLTPEVSPGHRVAASIIHSQETELFVESPSEFCLSCHDASRSPISRFASSLSAPRFHVRASHVFGQELIPGSGKAGSVLRIQDELPQHLVLINGRTECQTCHSMKSKHDYLLSQRIEDGLCTSCHDMQRESEPSPILTSNQ